MVAQYCISLNVFVTSLFKLALLSQYHLVRKRRETSRPNCPYFVQAPRDISRPSTLYQNSIQLCKHALSKCVSQLANKHVMADLEPSSMVVFMDVCLQVRMQAEGKLAAGKMKKYPNAIKAYGIIAR